MADRTWVALRRQARVEGWTEQNHTAEEIVGIQTYLTSGDKAALPQMYKDREPSRVRGAALVGASAAEVAAAHDDAKEAVPPAELEPMTA
jgi:hypothetical protein